MTASEMRSENVKRRQGQMALERQKGIKPCTTFKNLGHDSYFFLRAIESSLTGWWVSSGIIRLGF